MNTRKITKSFSLLISIALFVFFSFTQIAMAEGLIPDCGTSCGFSDFLDMVSKIVNFLLYQFTLPVAALVFAYAGWLYVTAGGDSGKISKAHELFKKVLIGITIMFGAWLLVKAILVGLGYNESFPQILQ